MAADPGVDKGTEAGGGTALADAQTPGPAGDLAALVEAHRRTILRLWRDEGPRKAFQALVRASRPLPMTLRLASLMVRVATAAGTQEAAGILLEATLEDVPPPLRGRMHRQRWRLWRRAGQEERAREALEAALAEPATPSRWRLERALGREPKRTAPAGVEAHLSASPVEALGVQVAAESTGVQPPGASSSIPGTSAPDEGGAASGGAAASEAFGQVAAQAAANDEAKGPAEASAAEPNPLATTDASGAGGGVNTGAAASASAAQQPASNDQQAVMDGEVGAASARLDAAEGAASELPGADPGDQTPREARPLGAGLAGRRQTGQLLESAGGPERAASRADAHHWDPDQERTPAAEVLPWSDDTDPEAAERISTDLFRLLSTPLRDATPALQPPANHREPLSATAPRPRVPAIDGRADTRPEFRSVEDVTPSEAHPLEALATQAATSPAGPGVPDSQEKAGSGHAVPTQRPPEGEVPEHDLGNWSEMSRASAEHRALQLSTLVARPTGARAPPTDEVTQRAPLSPVAGLQDPGLAPAASVSVQAGASEPASASHTTVGGTPVPRPAAPVSAPGPQQGVVASRPTLAGGRAPNVLELSPHTDPGTILRKEAGFVARGAWRELAAFYRRRAERSGSVEERAEYQARLAELLESELGDAQAAAAVYGEMVAAGEDGALAEQLRLLEATRDREGARRALDSAVISAETPQAEVASLVTRGEWLLATAAWREAQEDFQAALSVSPTHLRALLGWTEARLHTGTQASLGPLRERLHQLPPRHPERSPGLKRLALLADALHEEDVAAWAWLGLHEESPDDAEAARHALVHARKQGANDKVEALLRAQLSRQPRGAEARSAREALWTLLEQQGKSADALVELRQATRAEPGHREAWLAIFERMDARGSTGEAAWALEQAATATEDEQRREETWRQLAQFTQERLQDPKRARLFVARADAMRELRMAGAPGPEADRHEPSPRGSIPEPDSEVSAAHTDPRAFVTGPLSAPPVRRTAAYGALSPGTLPVVGPEATAARSAGEATAHTRVTGDASALRSPGEATQVHSGASPLTRSGIDSTAVRAMGVLPGPSKRGGGTGLNASVSRGPQSAPRSLAKRVVETPPPSSAELLPTRPGGASDESPDLLESASGETQLPPSLARPAGARAAVLLNTGFERIRVAPLEPDGYRTLAEGFSLNGDGGRSLLMVELARALEGEAVGPAEAPALELGANDRAGLRHPILRQEAGELLALVGHAFCRLFPSPPELAKPEAFRLDSGRGAPAATEALLASVRVLGIRASEVALSEEPGPPFGVVRPDAPHLMVGRMAVQRVLPGAELRFFAGRALMSQEPDLLVLRGLRREQLVQALSLLGVALSSSSVGEEAASLRDALSLRARQRLEILYPRVSNELRYVALADAARDSANRAGLVACGAVGPALAALRSKKALEREMVELIRFATSERYFQLRQRAVGRSA